MSCSWRRGLKQDIFEGGVGAEAVEVYVAFYAVYAAALGKLPDVMAFSIVVEFGLAAAVACQKQYVVVEARCEVVLVEFVTAVDDGCHTVVSFAKTDELCQTVLYLAA